MTVKKSYKDQQGNFQDTPFLTESDSLQLGFLIYQANDWIDGQKSLQQNNTNPHQGQQQSPYQQQEQQPQQGSFQGNQGGDSGLPF
jgi:hypothetical protein